VRGPVRAIIWDFDDTLMATGATRWPALQEAGARLGLDITRSAIARYWGAPFTELIARLASDVPFDAFLAHYRDILPLHPPSPTPGAARALTVASDAGILSCVVSSGRRDLIELDLATTDLRRRVARIWGDDDVSHPKPDGRALTPALRWLARQGVGRDEVVAIGDHPRDQQAAWRQRIFFVAVLTGASRTLDFRACDMVGNLDELLGRGWFATVVGEQHGRQSPGAAEPDPDRSAVMEFGVGGGLRQPLEDDIRGQCAGCHFLASGPSGPLHVVGQ
jgi:phosphoglycolate phosphatase-like HAD superfamily hydrolase